MKHTTIDISPEMLLEPHQTGFKLSHPKIIHQHIENGITYQTVDHLFKQVFNIYFLDGNSIIQKLNEATVASCGYASIKESIGKTAHVAADKFCAEKLIKDDNLVISQKRAMFFEEEFIRLDQSILSAISFKSPLYDEDNNIVGIFGCSFVLNDYKIKNIVDIMNNLLYLGLIPKYNTSINPTTILSGKRINDTYLSDREYQCINLLIKGKTYKMIAKTLSLSPRTVEHYIENIKVKLNVSSKAELVEKIIDYLFKYNL